MWEILTSSGFYLYMPACIKLDLQSALTAISWIVNHTAAFILIYLYFLRLEKLLSIVTKKVGKWTLSIAAPYNLPGKKCEWQSVSTCEVTWESGTSAWSHCLVLQTLSKFRRFLHLVLQRLQSIHCLWWQWWFWKKSSEKVRKLWDCQTSLLNLEVEIQQNSFTFFRGGRSWTAAVTFRQ